jgi:hypothetical protein
LAIKACIPTEIIFRGLFMDGLNASRLSVHGEYSGFGKRFEYCICFHKVSVAR